MSTRPFIPPRRISWLFIAAAPFAFASCSSTADRGEGGLTSSGGAPTAGGSTTSGVGSPTAGTSGSGMGGAAAMDGLATKAGAGGDDSGVPGRAAAGGMGPAAPMNAGGVGGAVASVNAGGASGAVAPMNAGGARSAGSSGGGSTGAFVLTSPDLKEGDHFAAKFTCASAMPMQPRPGNAPNPELDWSSAPSGTMSFAITFIDTTLGDNNPLGQHWAVWNIPASVMKFPQGTMALTGDLAMAKQSGPFFPPCAQSLMNGMDDQYEFTVYALGTATLNVQGMSVANALAALKSAQVLGKAVLRGHAGKNGM